MCDAIVVWAVTPKFKYPSPMSRNGYYYQPQALIHEKVLTLPLRFSICSKDSIAIAKSNTQSEKGNLAAST